MPRRIPQPRGNAASQRKADGEPANDLLPPEILEQIFRVLLANDPVAITQLALVCRSWSTQADRLQLLHIDLESRSRVKQLIGHVRDSENVRVKTQSLTLTQHRLLSLTQNMQLSLRDDDLFGLAKLCEVMDLTDLSSLTLKGYHNGDHATAIALSFITDIQHIPIPDPAPYAFPNLRSLDLRNVHPQVALSVLTACDPTKLEDLTTSSLVAPGPPPRPLPWETQLPSLRSLTSVFGFSVSGDLTIPCLLSSSPSLERFKILIAQKDFSWMVKCLWQVPSNAFGYLSVHVLQGRERGSIHQTVEELAKLAEMKGWAHDVTAHDAWSERKVQEILSSA